MRIALYTHDTLGLGHTQRVAKLARGLIQALPDARCLLLTGLEKPGLFPPSDRIDFVRVPGVMKIAAEKYRARRLDVPLDTLISIRSSVLSAAVESFRPALFIVDNVPRGANGELLPVLERLKAAGRRVKTALLLRDVLDSQRHIRSTWAGRGDYEALVRFYDRILIFSQPEVFNPLEAYRFPPAAAQKSRFCGFLGILSSGHRGPTDQRSFPRAGIPMVTVTVGGGEDGFSLIWSYLKGVLNGSGLNDIQHLVLLGPFIPESKRDKIMAAFGHVPNLFIHFYVSDLADWLRASDLVVSMGGYNTVYESLSLKKKLLVVPRVYPRREQFIRAKNLARRGLIEMIHPGRLTPELIRRKVTRMLATPARKPLGPALQFDGLEHGIGELRDLLPNHPSADDEAGR